MALDRNRGSRPPILVIGRRGQIASSLGAISDDKLSFLCLGRREGVDIRDRDSLRVALERYRPDLVVNAAGYTSVNLAENSRDAAFGVNADGVALLAQLCAERGIPIIHISTDYVFDGTKQSPYVESDPPSPINVYGASKAAGEAALRNSTDQYLILRTSWLYSPFGTNFVKTMLRLVQSQEEIAIVADQLGCPTAAQDVAVAIRTIAGRLQEGGGAFGLFHLAGAEAATWFDFANGIFDLAALHGAPRPRTVATQSPQHSEIAPRPPDSRLSSDKIAAAYGIALPSWHQSLGVVLAQFLSGDEAV